MSQLSTVPLKKSLSQGYKTRFLQKLANRQYESHLRCRLESDDGKIKFQAFLPPAQSKCASYLACIIKELIISTKRFSIPFQDDIDATAAFLLSAFNNSIDLVKKFFSRAKP